MKWGTFTFKIIPFGLVNVGATFQHVTDNAFHGLIIQSMLVYLDDVNFFSKKRSDHLRYLKRTFEQYRKYEISINPKKIIFAISEEISWAI